MIVPCFKYTRKHAQHIYSISNICFGSDTHTPSHEAWQNQHDWKSDISLWISLTLKRRLISHNFVCERGPLFPRGKKRFSHVNHQLMPAHFCDLRTFPWCTSAVSWSYSVQMFGHKIINIMWDTHTHRSRDHFNRLHKEIMRTKRMKNTGKSYNPTHKYWCIFEQRFQSKNITSRHHIYCGGRQVTIWSSPNQQLLQYVLSL